MASLTRVSDSLFDDAFVADMVIRAAIREAEASFLRMGEKLYEVIILKHYRTLGYTSFGSYCADIGISRSFAYQLADTHEKFVLRAQCPTVVLLGVGVRKLGLLLPLLESGDLDYGDELYEWLFNLSVLTTSDAITKKRRIFGDETGVTVPWQRKALLWKAIAKKYYRRYRNNNNRREQWNRR